jgi:hypothetical protein
MNMICVVYHGADSTACADFTTGLLLVIVFMGHKVKVAATVEKDTTALFSLFERNSHSGIAEWFNRLESRNVHEATRALAF